jgi:hypothetical protein
MKNLPNDFIGVASPEFMAIKIPKSTLNAEEECIRGGYLDQQLHRQALHMVHYQQC